MCNDYSLDNIHNKMLVKERIMQINWKWFLIGLVLGLLLGCQPVDIPNYNIINGWSEQ